jgi:hypothetical protein
VATSKGDHTTDAVEGLSIFGCFPIEENSLVLFIETK